MSGIVGLAATDATTTMLVNVLISVGPFQCDLQNEPTRDGLAAAWVKGSISGQRPRIAQLDTTDDLRQAFRDGVSIAALARQHSASRVAICAAVANLRRNQPERPAPATEVSAAVTRVEMPGKVAQHVSGQNGLAELEREALRTARTVRRRQGSSMHITAEPKVHHRLVRAGTALNSAGASSADCKAYRIYLDRVSTAAGTQHAEPVD